MSTVVERYYDENFEAEWNRLGDSAAEFEITKKFLDRYINPGDTVFDVGGGPGRYSLHLAERGCDVTLLDLSKNHVDFALKKADERNVKIRGIHGNALSADTLAGEKFDHVLLMGPLYHLTEQSDRDVCIRACMNSLKPGGTLFAAFISSYAGIIFAMRQDTDCILNPAIKENFDLFAEDKPFTGIGFTENYFARHADIVPMMEGFGLTTLHLASAEGMLAPSWLSIKNQPPEILNAWIELAYSVCEREDLLSFAEHYLYIGKK